MTESIGKIDETVHIELSSGVRVSLLPGQKGVKKSDGSWDNIIDTTRPGKIFLSKAGTKPVLLTYLDLFVLLNQCKQHEGRINFYAKMDKAKIEQQIAGAQGLK